LNDKFLSKIYNVHDERGSEYPDIDRCQLRPSADGLDVDFNLFPLTGALGNPKQERKQVKFQKACVDRLKDNRNIWPYLLEHSFRNMRDRPACPYWHQDSCDIRDLYRLWLGLPMVIESFHKLWYDGIMYQTLDNCDGSPIFIRKDDGKTESLLIVEHKRSDGVWECQSSEGKGQVLLDIKEMHQILNQYPLSDVIYGVGPAAVKLD
jgi:hypothetical protein